MADITWIGDSIAVAQVSTYTLTLAWASGDDATITINGKGITVTSGPIGGSANDMAATLAAAINSTDTSTTTLDIIGDETKNIGGQNVAEFKAVIATAVANVLTLTGSKDGVPFTATSSETTAGTGIITDATPTAATGPNHYDQGLNWDTGLVPPLGSDVFFNQGGSNCLYGLTGNNDLASFTRTVGYGGKIGLPRVNPAGYIEYLPTHLQIEPDLTGNTLDIDSSGGYTNIDTNDENGTITVTAGTVSLITGTGAITLTALAGNITLGNRGNDTCRLGVLTVGDLGGKQATVNIASSAVWNVPTGEWLIIYNGKVTSELGLAATTVIHQGSYTVNGVPTDAHTLINVYGGRLVFNGLGGAITTLYLYGGGADFSGDLRTPKTVTNMSMEKGSFFWDPLGVVPLALGIDLVNCGLHEVDIKSEKNKTWTPSAI